MARPRHTGRRASSGQCYQVPFGPPWGSWGQWEVGVAVAGIRQPAPRVRRPASPEDGLGGTMKPCRPTPSS
jgi:hypothetical protein